MYSKITKVFILLIFVKRVFGNDFCQRKEFTRIYTKEIYTKNNNTYSLIEIIVDDKGYSWDLEFNKVSEPHAKPGELSIEEKRFLTRIFIPVLRECDKRGGDCEELMKLSNIAIDFYETFNEPKTYLYQLTKFKFEHEMVDINSEDLPWNMSVKGDPSVKSDKKQNLWPDNWIYQVYPLATYDPTRGHLMYVIVGDAQLGTTKIYSKSLSLNNWTQDWEVFDSGRLYSFIGIVTVMAINGQTKHTIWNGMDRVFLFENRADEVHAVYEYGVKSIIKSVGLLGLKPFLKLIVLIFFRILVIINCLDVPKRRTKCLSFMSLSEFWSLLSLY